jgi:hypothetical protein
VKYSALCVLAVTALTPAWSVPAADPSATPVTPSAPAAPAYTPDGKLMFPDNYREWIFLSSGLDMSYREKPGTAGLSSFDNVFVDPAAYRDFERNGTWPDKTLLVLESRGAAGKGSINRHGKFQTTERMGVEVHVKDLGRFSGGWAFFSFEGTEPANRIPVSEPCYSCHRQHAAVDTTFVQFYPTLLDIAGRKGTMAPGYRP